MAHSKVVVLVVEDEPLVRMGIVDHLEEEGFAVLEAANADDAIAILSKNTTIRILFTDIDMPGEVDGIKLAAAVRDRWPPIKIVITSGHRRPLASDLPAGAQFFAKPYNPDTIARTFRGFADA